MKPVFVIYSLLYIVVKDATAWTCNDYNCAGANCDTAATCDSGTKPCQTNKMTLLGQEVTHYSCSATDSCTSIATNISALGITVSTCCSADLCNDGTNPPLEQNLAYCYSASCDSEGCLSNLINYIDSNDVGAFCPTSEDGCQTSLTTTTDSDTGTVTTLESTGCASSPCTPLSQFLEGLQLSSYCCKDRLCNNGGEMSVDPDKGYCYAYSCIGSDPSSCLSVAEVVQQGKMSYCEKQAGGCFHSSIIGTNSTIITSGCVGPQYNVNLCVPVTMTVGDLSTTTICCSEDRCNDGEETSAPDKEYCYAYTCIPPACLTLPQAIAQGQTSLCEKREKGCYTTTLTSADSTMISSGCVGSIPNMNECIPSFMTQGDNQTITTCCSTDKCNDGTTDQATVDPSKEYCHVYECTATTSIPCMSLSEAIRQGRTTQCERPEKGCFAMKTQGTSVMAGCVGESYGMSSCSTAPPSGDSEVICCKGNGCNNRFTSASCPVFSHGVASLLLIVLCLLQTMATA